MDEIHSLGLFVTTRKLKKEPSFGLLLNPISEVRFIK